MFDCHQPVMIVVEHNHAFCSVFAQVQTCLTCAVFRPRAHTAGRGAHLGAGRRVPRERSGTGAYHTGTFSPRPIRDCGGPFKTEQRNPTPSPLDRSDQGAVFQLNSYLVCGMRVRFYRGCAGFP